MPGGYLGLGDQDGLSLSVGIDAPVWTEKPIPEIVDYRKIAIGIPVVEKMELLLSPEPGKSSQPWSRHVVVFIKIEVHIERDQHRRYLNDEQV